MSRLQDPETLFKDGAWEIRGIPGYEEMFDEVWHKCPWPKNLFLKKKEISTYQMEHIGCCPNCGTDIPDSIIGVWKLKNFDLIQNQQNYNKQWVSYPGGFYLFNTTKTVTNDYTFYARPGQIWMYDPRGKV